MRTREQRIRSLRWQLEEIYRCLRIRREDVANLERDKAEVQRMLDEELTESEREELRGNETING